LVAWLKTSDEGDSMKKNRTTNDAITAKKPLSPTPSLTTTPQADRTNIPSPRRQTSSSPRWFLWATGGLVASAVVFAAVLACNGIFSRHADDPLDPTKTPKLNPPEPPGPAPDGMVWVPGGWFWMGSDEPEAKPDEKPVHLVYVDGFWMDRTEVTNEQFAQFVRETGHVTDNEKRLESNGFLHTTPDKVEPGGLVFRPPPGNVEVCNHCDWWVFQKGANWRQPEGPGTSIAGKDKHPVVQVSWNDAVAFCRWRSDKEGQRYRLPTEAEWEFAARGGLDRLPYVWGQEKVPDGRWQANIWQGKFPKQNTLEDGFEGTAPVASFPPNGYGLHDMAGNAWEWCADWYDHDYYLKLKGPTYNPKGPESAEESYDPDPREPGAKKVTRGGSFLCSDVYCIGYRPSARMKSSPFTGLVHTGFRCVQVPR
jgi:formylglycine-generating enzyme required for sulfatase activity